MSDPGATLTDDEVKDASGGYVRPDKQLQALLDRGYWRAWRSPVTGKVVLERPHFLAVSSGATQPKPAPKLHLARA